ncbi:hypothetical protein SESBI_27158 [Sesbania bispinosa]|nr:hypothetical protein SESBI_27158 [Sesbania bispinosa]
MQWWLKGWWGDWVLRGSRATTLPRQIYMAAMWWWLEWPLRMKGDSVGGMIGSWEGTMRQHDWDKGATVTWEMGGSDLAEGWNYDWVV